MLPPSSSSPPSRCSAGFTLIELLLVIVVIAILVAITLPLLGRAQTYARKVQAVNDMRNMKTSIVSYYTDYQKYPINSVQQNATQYGDYDTVYGDSGQGALYSTADLFDILRAVPDSNYNQNNVLNPNATVYWTGQFAANLTRPRNGITRQDVKVGNHVIPSGSFVDGWGNSYVVWIDANKDGDLSTAAGWFYSDIKAGDVHPGLPPMGLAFASMGPDGQFGTKGNGVLQGSDDIVTWVLP